MKLVRITHYHVHDTDDVLKVTSSKVKVTDRNFKKTDFCGGGIPIHSGRPSSFILVSSL